MQTSISVNYSLFYLFGEPRHLNKYYWLIVGYKTDNFFFLAFASLIFFSSFPEGG